VPSPKRQRKRPESPTLHAATNPRATRAHAEAHAAALQPLIEGLRGDMAALTEVLDGHRCVGWMGGEWFAVQVFCSAAPASALASQTPACLLACMHMAPPACAHTSRTHAPHVNAHRAAASSATKELGLAQQRAAALEAEVGELRRDHKAEGNRLLGVQVR